MFTTKYMLGCSVLLVLAAATAYAQVFTFAPPPSPAGTVIPPSITGKETYTYSYSIRADEKDTVTVNGQNALQGDEFVEIFPGYGDPNAPSGKVVQKTISDANPALGIKQGTYAVRLKSLGIAATQTTVTDTYFVGDNRLPLDNTGRRDRN